MGLWPHGAEPRRRGQERGFPACILKASRGPALISDSPWRLQHNLGYDSEHRCGRPGPLPPPAETRQSGLPEAIAEATPRPADGDSSRLPKCHSVLTGPCEQRFLRLWPRHPCTRPRFTPTPSQGPQQTAPWPPGRFHPFSRRVQEPALALVSPGQRPSLPPGPKLNSDFLIRRGFHSFWESPTLLYWFGHKNNFHLNERHQRVSL